MESYFSLTVTLNHLHPSKSYRSQVQRHLCQKSAYFLLPLDVPLNLTNPRLASCESVPSGDGSAWGGEYCSAPFSFHGICVASTPCESGSSSIPLVSLAASSVPRTWEALGKSSKTKWEDQSSQHPYSTLGPSRVGLGGTVGS